MDSAISMLLAIALNNPILLCMCISHLDSNDFVPLDTINWIWSNRQCYQLVILNDNVSEPVESFRVSLGTAWTGQDVTFVNQTLTVSISDDGEMLYCTIIIHVLFTILYVCVKQLIYDIHW